GRATGGHGTSAGRADLSRRPGIRRKEILLSAGSTSGPRADSQVHPARHRSLMGCRPFGRGPIMEAPPARSEKFVLLPMLLRLLRLPLPAAAILVLLAAPLSGQSDRSIPIPALPASTRSRMLGEITPPAGFELTIFAAPPHLTYPTCLYPADGGVVYVCTDPNLLFGRERYLGRVLRFVDADGDGIAERYTVFADSLDSVRGITVVGDEVFLMHAPVLAAYRDSDGDGVADSRRVVVEGLGFGLDDRNGDHTANSLRLGLDGAIYVAVGDYGFLRATGTDGRQIYLHRG